MKLQTLPPHTSETKTTQAAFTLIELLTVIAIIAILVAILIPSIGKVRQSARSAANLSQLRQASMAVIQFSNLSGKYPRLWGNQNDFPGAGDAWYSIPAIRDALGDSSPNQDSNHSVCIALMSPAQETAENIPENYTGIITHFSLTPGIGNKHPSFNPPLSTASVINPSQLILLADGGVQTDNDAGKLYGGARAHMWQLNNLALGDVNDPEPIDFEMAGIAKMNFDRHGNGTAQVSFCDGHVESRAPDEFYYKNFAVGP